MRAPPLHATDSSVCSVQWQAPVLVKLAKPVDVKGNPWPLDDNGKPILNA